MYLTEDLTENLNICVINIKWKGVYVEVPGFLGSCVIQPSLLLEVLDY